jgi:hypothetical protein
MSALLDRLKIATVWAVAVVYVLLLAPFAAIGLLCELAIRGFGFGRALYDDILDGVQNLL